MSSQRTFRSPCHVEGPKRWCIPVSARLVFPPRLGTAGSALLRRPASWRWAVGWCRGGCCRLRAGHDHRVADTVGAAGEEGVNVMSASRALHVVRQVHVVDLSGVPHGACLLASSGCGVSCSQPQTSATGFRPCTLGMSPTALATWRRVWTGERAAVELSASYRRRRREVRACRSGPRFRRSWPPRRCPGG